MKIEVFKHDEWHTLFDNTTEELTTNSDYWGTLWNEIVENEYPFRCTECLPKSVRMFFEVLHEESQKYNWLGSNQFRTFFTDKDFAPNTVYIFDMFEGYILTDHIRDIERYLLTLQDLKIAIGL